jgi:hypothetical protein
LLFVICHSVKAGEWAQGFVMRTLLALIFGSLIAAAGLEAKDARPAEARSAAAEAADPNEAWREARLRPQDSRLADLLRDGVARSATFRALVNRLESGQVIVYLSTSLTLRSTLAGKLTWMTKAGAFRYVKATINANQTADQMIATLAHELQHALEVSDDLDVTDQRSMLALYKRIGRPSHSILVEAWETQAAHDAGVQVRRELLATL